MAPTNISWKGYPERPKTQPNCLMIRSMVTHAESALIIRIPTKNPSIVHEYLMRGVVSGIKAYLRNPDKTETDCECIAELTELLQTLVPTNDKLVSGYGSC